MAFADIRDIFLRAMRSREDVEKGSDKDKPQIQFNRSEKRMMGMRPKNNPHGRHYGDRPTGQSNHFRQWMREAEQNRVLRRIPTEEWLEKERPKGFPTAVVSEISARYRTIWHLSQAPRSHMLLVPGLGEGNLKKLQDALIRRGLTPIWAERELAE